MAITGEGATAQRCPGLIERNDILGGLIHDDDRRPA
jgi:hypothetical protein